MSKSKIPTHDVPAFRQRFLSAGAPIDGLVRLGLADPPVVYPLVILTAGEPAAIAGILE